MRDPEDELVCVAVHKKGAAEVVRRLAACDENGAARKIPRGAVELSPVMLTRHRVCRSRL